MANQDSGSLIDALAQYESQLTQVELAIDSTSPGPDYDSLISLRSDIKELIALTRETLSNVQKQTNIEPETSDPLAKEYALFKAELEESNENNSVAAEFNVETIQDDLEALKGMKCQAPHTHQWGEISYHNALVCGVESEESISSMEEIQVRVMFTNPTHREMLPCPYFLDGECRFSDEKCHFSHGELVYLSSLKEYKEPDFTSVRPEAGILVKNDNLWHRAIVLSHPSNNKCDVKLESSGKQCEVDLHDILPLEVQALSRTGSNDTDNEDDNYDDDSEESDTGVDPVLVEQSLLREPTKSALGEWEKHTKGFGSRLMAQMGYVIGMGLGKNGEGRLEPVPAVVLPAGKSLDHCMELRERAGGDENLFKVEKRLRRLQKKEEQRQKQIEQKEKNNKNIFDFINSKLGGRRGNVNELQSSTQKVNKKEEVTSKTLKTESNRNLNLVGFHVGEEIRRAEQDIVRMQTSLSRHQEGSTTHKHICNQIKDKQCELKQLKVSESSINQECKRRKDHQKLTIF